MFAFILLLPEFVSFKFTIKVIYFINVVISILTIVLISLFLFRNFFKLQISFFNCINFSARIGIVIYLLQKYIVPKIKGSIIYEKESLRILEQQYDEFKNQYDGIDKQIKSQEQLYFDLQNKFEIWQAALVQEQQKYDHMCKHYEQKLAYQFEKKMPIYA